MKTFKYLFLVLLISLINLNIVFAEDINLNNFTDYRDKALELKFNYPKNWGEIKTQYNNNIGEINDYFVADYEYDIDFSSASQFILAGGEKPIGIIEYTYDTSIDDLCNSADISKDSIFFSHITSCEKNNNIISFISSPKYDIYCGDPGNKYLIRKIVAIDLVDSDFMDVLTFRYSFLSEEVQKELTDIIDQAGGCSYEEYSETETLFNNKVQEILDKIESGEIDDETKENLENFDVLVNSIQDWRAFEQWPEWSQEAVTWSLNKNILDSDEKVLEEVSEDSFKYTLAKMLYSYHINNGGEEYNGEIMDGSWPSWADLSISWAINQKIFDSAETVSQKVSGKDFKYMLATMVYRYYLSVGGYDEDFEDIQGNWPEWADEGVAFALDSNNRIIDSAESVMQPVDEEAFKYILSVMLKRYDYAQGYLTIF